MSKQWQIMISKAHSSKLINWALKIDGIFQRASKQNSSKVIHYIKFQLLAHNSMRTEKSNRILIQNYQLRYGANFCIRWEQMCSLKLKATIRCLFSIKRKLLVFGRRFRSESGLDFLLETLLISFNRFVSMLS